MSKESEGDEPSAKAVLAYLNAHPEFLAENGFVSMTAPFGNIIDLTPAIARRARKEAQEMSATNRSILHVAAENMASWRRLHLATLALLASADITSLCEVVEQDFPAIFDVKECHLVTYQPHSMLDSDGFTKTDEASINAALNGKAMILGPPNEAALSLLQAPAPSIAMIRLPDRLLSPVSNCLLLLAGKDKTSFTPDLGGDLLILLAEMVGVTLAARVEIATRGVRDDDDVDDDPGDDPVDNPSDNNA